jgi:mannosylglycerate hydrolase
MEKQYEIHLISHTHWDREWYLTFQQFRLKLVELVDSLLEILETNPDFRHFNFDGQTIVLEDYLEIKPQNRARLQKQIQAGRIAVGPWYILPDEFLVSPEATVRNLMLGHKIANAFGKVMKVGYIPDPFGHLSQIPQILRGFGIDNVILWRGFGGEPDQTNSEYYWEAPDGSRVLFIHFLPIGYSETLHLPTDPEQAAAVISRLKEALQQRATTPYLMLFNGSDHIRPQPEIPQIIQQVNAKLDDAVVVHSSLTEYLGRLRASVPQDLKVVRGEFRGGFKYAYLLTGVLSTRMYLKQENEKAQTLLEKWAEPSSSFAWLLGELYPQEFLWQSWKYLMQNHPHDSICGCSVDAVHDQMMARFAWSEEIAEELTVNNLKTIVSKINTAGATPTVQYLAVFNPLGWTRSDVVHANLDFLTPDQTSNVPDHPNAPVSPYPEEVKGFVIQDEQGREVPYQLIKRSICMQIVPSMVTFPVLQKVVRFELLFKADDVPACGYKTYTVIPQPAIKDYHTGVQSSLCTGVSPLVCQSSGMENEHLEVEIQSNGSLTIVDKNTGKIYDSCHVFEDGGDVGDEYNYSYPLRDRIVSSIGLPAVIELVEQGPLRVTYKVSQILLVPAYATSDRQGRNQETVAMPIISSISLAVGAKRVEITTEVDNTAQDHRLRVLFPSGIQTDYSYAEGHYDVVKRPIKLPDPNAYPIEKPCPTHPQRAFVDVNDGDNGLAIINQGLPEYEVKDDDCRTVALTLLRGVDAISHSDLLTRPGGNAGWPYSTPGGQCLGKHTFHYAIAPHRGTWQDSLVYREAHQHNVPCRIVQADAHPGELPKTLSFVSVSPASFIISAIKKAETEDALIVRVYNASDQETTGEIRVFQQIKRAALTNLNEELLETITPNSEYTVTIQARPWEVKTVQLNF